MKCDVEKAIDLKWVDLFGYCSASNNVFGLNSNFRIEQKILIYQFCFNAFFFSYESYPNHFKCIRMEQKKTRKQFFFITQKNCYRNNTSTMPVDEYQYVPGTNANCQYDVAVNVSEKKTEIELF